MRDNLLPANNGFFGTPPSDAEAVENARQFLCHDAVRSFLGHEPENAEQHALGYIGNATTALVRAIECLGTLSGEQADPLRATAQAALDALGRDPRG